MQRLQNWDDLRFFLAVARSHGLSGAARQLGVNQSTVSRRVAQLEGQLDARLFERHARGYALTAAGEEMMTLAMRVEDDVLAVDRTIQGADRALRGSIHLTTVDEVLEAVAPHLREFRTEYPEIELVVDTDLRALSLTRREADVALRPGEAPAEPDVVGRKLVSLPMGLYAAASYLEARGRPRRMRALSRHDLIGSSRPGRDDWVGVVDSPCVRFRADSMSARAIAARAGLGVARLPRFMGDGDPQLERLFCPKTDSAFFLWLLIHADLRQTARVRAFVDFLSEAIVADRARYEGGRPPA